MCVCVRAGRETCCVLRDSAERVTPLGLPTRTPMEWAGGPFALPPGPGVHKAVTRGVLARGGARSLTLGTVARPKQGLLVLAVICRGGEGLGCTSGRANPTGACNRLRHPRGGGEAAGRGPGPLIRGLPGAAAGRGPPPGPIPAALGGETSAGFVPAVSCGLSQCLTDSTGLQAAGLHLDPSPVAGSSPGGPASPRLSFPIGKMATIMSMS